MEIYVFVDLSLQFVSAMKQFKSLLIDKHAGSVRIKEKYIIDFEKSNEFYAFLNYVIL